jgi:hypothetical protein
MCGSRHTTRQNTVQNVREPAGYAFSIQTTYKHIRTGCNIYVSHLDKLSIEISYKHVPTGCWRLGLDFHFTWCAPASRVPQSPVQYTVLYCTYRISHVLLYSCGFESVSKKLLKQVCWLIKAGANRLLYSFANHTTGWHAIYQVAVSVTRDSAAESIPPSGAAPVLILCAADFL